MHALLWIEPLVNHGVYDAGWNCRDHALIVAAILAVQRVPLQVVHGRSMFVVGPSGDRPPAGVGQDVNDTTTHTWLEVPSIGIVDVSPNLRCRNHPTWRPAPLDGIIASRWIPEGKHTVLRLNSASEYEREIAMATHRNNQWSALYWARTVEPFVPVLFHNAFDYVNSPLTDRLREKFQQSIYAKAASHFIDRTGGIGRSLGAVSRSKAWLIINRRPENTVEDLIKLIEPT